MADNEMILRIGAKTDEFIKNVESAKLKIRSLSMQMAEIDKQLKTESVDRVQKLGEKLELAKRAAAAEETNLNGDMASKRELIRMAILASTMTARSGRRSWHHPSALSWLRDGTITDVVIW